MTEPVDDVTAANAAKRAVHVKVRSSLAKVSFNACVSGVTWFTVSRCCYFQVSFEITHSFSPQWQGKTIALGTFPAADAEEKCAKAKALTRAWRSGMRPKPTRDWVINELERLGIRVVSGGRASRKGEDEGISTSNITLGSQPNMMLMGMNATANPQMNGAMGTQQVNMAQNAWNQQDSQNNLKQARRSSSLGLSLLSNEFGKNNSFHNTAQPSTNNSANMDLLGKPAFRELVGGGAAAAYNAYRDDFYRQQPADQGNGSGGTAENGSGVGNTGVSALNMSNTTATNPNE